MTPARWLTLALLAVTLAYAQGLPGLFLHDDFANIVANKALQVSSVAEIDVRAVSAIQPARPLAMTSFAVNHAVCGLSPACFKIVNLALHLACGVALFVLLRMLFRRRDPGIPFHPDYLAAAIAVIWLAHPLNVSTVLYVVQRMTIIATLGVLVALIAWLRFRDAPRANWPWLLVFVASTGIGLLAKEAAILAIPLALLLDAAIHRPTTRQMVITATLFVLAGLAALFMLRHRFLDGYTIRDFTLAERLMTEARVLFFYLSELLYPLPQRMSLFLDDFRVSRGLVDPATTLPAIAGILALAVSAAWFFLRRHSLVALGVLFFFTGHLLESTIWALEIAYEHRNYLSGIGVILAVTLMAARLMTVRTARLAGITFAVLLLVLLTFRTHAWSSMQAMALDLSQARPQSARANLLIASYWRGLYMGAEENSPLAAELLATTRFHLEFATAADPRMVTSVSALLALPSTPEQEARYWNLMAERVRNGAFSADTVNGTLSMAVCLILEACAYRPENVDIVLMALLANPTLSPDVRTRVTHVAGAFKVRVMHDADSGLALSAVAMRSGVPRYRVTHLENLVAAGRQQEARALYPLIQADPRLTQQEREKAFVAMADVPLVPEATRQQRHGGP